MLKRKRHKQMEGGRDREREDTGEKIEEIRKGRREGDYVKASRPSWKYFTSKSDENLYREF